MAVKEWFRRLEPVQLYLVLFFTTGFFVVEIAASHITHALTLLINAYHMLCNIVALVGCIASVKYGCRENYNDDSNRSSLVNSSTCIDAEGQSSAVSLPSKVKSYSHSDREMKNTFGWARIEILTMLSCCVVIASFCFLLLIEALQTLAHIDHLDEMHHPLPVMCIGGAGILLNIFCYVLIGGYTFNQVLFLRVTGSGNILQRRANSQSMKDGNQQLSVHPRQRPLALPKSQGFREVCRDFLGCVLVMLVSLVVYFTDRESAKYVDPVFASISAIALFVQSYPYMKESGLILLQTIPNHINIDSLKRELLEAFPGIVNVHDLHVWQMTGEKSIATVHIVFLDQTVYASITDQITAFFLEMGITQVTVQPEFCKMTSDVNKIDCLIPCHDEHCNSSQCCSTENVSDDESQPMKPVKPVKRVHTINKKFEKKEIIPAPSAIGLKKFTLYTNDSRHSDKETEDLKGLGANQLDEQYSSQDEENKGSNSSVCTIDVDVNEHKCSDKAVTEKVHEDCHAVV